MTSIIPKKTFEKNYDTFTSFIFVWSLAATNISSHKCFNFSRDIITTIVAITINMMAAIKKWDNRHQNSGHHDDSRHHHYYGKHHLSSPRLLAITIVDIITMMVMRLRHLAFRRSDPDRDATSSVLQLLCYNIHHHHHIFLSSSPPLSSSFFLTVIFFLKNPHYRDATSSFLQLLCSNTHHHHQLHPHYHHYHHHHHHHIFSFFGHHYRCHPQILNKPHYHHTWILNFLAIETTKYWRRHLQKRWKRNF